MYLQMSTAAQILDLLQMLTLISKLPSERWGLKKNHDCFQQAFFPQAHWAFECVHFSIQLSVTLVTVIFKNLFLKTASQYEAV